ERAAYFTTVDYDNRLAIVAVERNAAVADGIDGADEAAGADGDEQIIGVIRYDRTADPAAETAEFALIVEDRYQHHGIGSVLFWALVDAARARGIRTLAADVLAENRRMRQMLRGTGLPSRSSRSGSAIRLELDLTPR